MLITTLFSAAAVSPAARALPVALLCAVLSTACAAPIPPSAPSAPAAPPAPPAPTAPAAPAATLVPRVSTITTASALQQLQIAIGDARCDQAAQCHVLPVGSKACGGPQSYLPYSDRAHDESRIQSLSQHYTALQRAQSRASGEISDCSMRLAPTAICTSDGRCALQDGVGTSTDPR